MPCLPFDNYVVEVEVFDLNVGKSSVFKLLYICVEPPFRLRWWFTALMILFIPSILFYVGARRKITAKEKVNKEKQITEAKFEA